MRPLWHGPVRRRWCGPRMCTRAHRSRHLCPANPALSAGVFRAWALVGAQMYAVPLRVPRTFYVDSALPPGDPDSPAQTLGGLQVQRTLPLGREPAHLYQARAPALGFGS